MADDSQLSSVLDNEGKLFGLVNIVDVLVVLLVAAIAVAGVALLFSPGGTNETRYVTVDVGGQPQYIADQITTGDEWTPQGGGSFVITDTYASPNTGEESEGTANILIRAAVNGSAIGEENQQIINFNGEPLSFGRELEIDATSYTITGTVTAVDQEGTEIETQSESLALETTVDRGIANQIDAGDQYRVGADTQLTIETVTVYPTSDENMRRVILGVTVQTRTVDGVPLFGERSVQTGSQIPVRTQAYTLTGEVLTIGSFDEPGVPATRTLTMEIEDLPPSRADAITVGLTESTQDITTAEILEKEDRPAERLVERDSGFEFIEHPRNRDLILTIEVSVRETQDGRIQFRGDQLNAGEELMLSLGGIQIEGTVTSIES